MKNSSVKQGKKDCSGHPKFEKKQGRADAHLHKELHTKEIISQSFTEWSFKWNNKKDSTNQRLYPD
jgi:hypothetical protein